MSEKKRREQEDQAQIDRGLEMIRQRQARKAARDQGLTPEETARATDMNAMDTEGRKLNQDLNAVDAEGRQLDPLDVLAAKKARAMQQGTDLLVRREPTTYAGGNMAEEARISGEILKPSAKERLEEEKPIGKKQLDKAREKLNKYKMGKTALDTRIVENEKWWRMQHMPMISKDIRRPTDSPSGWLFNSLANKHADAMDNYPSPSVLPREAADRKDAETLSSVLPVILEQNNFEQTYDETWQQKLKSGNGCYGVFWNNRKQNGLGDVEIRRVDVLNLFWEPRIDDIQESRDLFYVYSEDNERLKAEYPQLEGKNLGNDISTIKYAYEETADETEKSSVVDWYYKKWQNGREVLHFCKFVGDVVLYATENEPQWKNRGIYDHGMYPFVLDVMYKNEGSPAGFGYVDIMKGVQTRIDRIQNAITENSLEVIGNRWFIRDSASLNEEEFKDHTNKLVHVAGDLSEENVRQITVADINGNYINILNNFIEELKQVSGNRDISNGGNESGVTAASAIAAVQEAGSKLSRDMIKASYRAFTKVCNLILENVRQFYTEQRTFRITGKSGEMEFVTFSNRNIQGGTRQGVFGPESRVPIFDIVVKAQKASPYSRISQNELAKEFFNMGFFNPQNTDISLNCLQMMDFEGKDELIQKIERNGTMYDKYQQLQAAAVKMASLIDQTNGSQILNSMIQQGLIDPNVGAVPGGVSAPTSNMKTYQDTRVERARAQSAESTAPR